MKAVVLDGHALNPGDLSWEGIESLCELTVYERTPKELIIERIKDAELIITNKVKITKEILELAPHIKYIGILATGFNIVDLEAANKLNITVTNIPSYSTEAVAQHVFSLLLEITNQVSSHNRAVKEGQWTNNDDFCFWNTPLIELSNKTIGIIGFGSIGQKVSEIANAFSMNVLTYNRTVKREYEHDRLKFVSLDELCERSDVISIHVPLSDQTKGLINEQLINKMKKGVIIINTARGPIINEHDLYQALKSDHVYSAGLDVVSEEPIKANNPLLNAKNTFITPHIAWAPNETRLRLLEIATKNIKAFLEGKPINVVN
ncbi:D-2-hydroxyacid dehydrogenase [Haloplasma contractile]|uniref:Glycerate dehydrogenase protein n=1 Tax=Haloplasma contractile SSD-17B TaxID=1033810 RepID=U2EG07_9MOLU|nr:D-2-hydroxyacid dehydrogenase [Haloplasma contractile]ERJ13551.1 glycerate dehydrogenase protein [Haloplasma contractile SSD-17B]